MEDEPEEDPHPEAEQSLAEEELPTNLTTRHGTPPTHRGRPEQRGEQHPSQSRSAPHNRPVGEGSAASGSRVRLAQQTSESARYQRLFDQLYNEERDRMMTRERERQATDDGSSGQLTPRPHLQTGMPRTQTTSAAIAIRGQDLGPIDTDSPESVRRYGRVELAETTMAIERIDEIARARAEERARAQLNRPEGSDAGGMLTLMFLL